MTASPRYAADTLRNFTSDLFQAAGVEAEKAAVMAHYLVEADLMGHTTHGLALVPQYLQSLADGIMTRSGTPDVVSDRGATVCWNGNRLPGAWLTAQGVALACERARKHGTATVVIGNSHHIGCLAAYLQDATSQGLMISIASSSPSGAQVAPFGGLKGLYTPDPVAHGIPTSGNPMLIDISASITTVNMSQRLIREGRKFDHDWLMDKEGNPTNDPATIKDGGTLLPTGGIDHGQKGYGMALHAEALTQGLAGYGRSDAPKGMNAAITIDVRDPEAFGGLQRFLKQTDWLADNCRANPPRKGIEAVRLPGDAALKRRAASLVEGVELYSGIVEDLLSAADNLKVAIPARISQP